MANISENPSILPFYAYGIDTPFQSSLRTPKLYSLSNDFSYNNGASIPLSSERKEIHTPFVLENDRLYYLDLGKIKLNEDSETLLLFDGKVASAVIYLNGYRISSIKNTLMGAVVRIDPFIKSSNHMYIYFENTTNIKEELVRSLKIVTVKKSRIIDIYPRSNLLKDEAHILCDITMVSGDMKVALGGKIKVELLDASGNIIETAVQPIDAFSRNYWKTIRVDIYLKDPHLWDIFDPYRYTIKATFSRFDDTIADIKEIPFGIREYSLKRYNKRAANSPCFLLNNHPIRITGYVVTEQDETLPKKLKKSGINAVRVVNPYNRRFFDACDKEGLLVMCEVQFELKQVKRTIFSQKRRETDPLDIPFSLIGEMIVSMKNYASIFCWSVGVRKLFGNGVLGEFIRSIDDTRAINCQGDSNFSLSDFFSADDCEVSQLRAIESLSLFFEGNILGIHYNPKIYRNYPFILCDVDLNQEQIVDKLNMFRKNERFLGLFLSSDEKDPSEAIKSLLKEINFGDKQSEVNEDS